ncbi:hypothetical protein [Sporosarcina sp. ACRSL]|uniref:hypothetical protein n=1 Tax=Sporosarcina sp. ACRSL TaxID=2918215 RepID=UPI001EF70A52|nr:hypothetical protein [Sporosarcina sp. ACRSL]
MATSVPHVELIETCWPWNDKEMTEGILDEYRTDDFQKKRDKLLRRLHETFGTDRVDVAECVRQTLQDRNNKVNLPTYDGLGIVSTSDIESVNRYMFDPERRQDEVEIKKMQNFLSQATTEEKLGFIRDASYWYILSSDYDSNVMELVGEILLSLQLENEMKRFVFRN